MSASHDFDKGDAGREERSSRAHAREDCEHWRVGNLLHPASNAIALHSDSYSHHFRLTAFQSHFCVVFVGLVGQRCSRGAEDFQGLRVSSRRAHIAIAELHALTLGVVPVCQRWALVSDDELCGALGNFGRFHGFGERFCAQFHLRSPSASLVSPRASVVQLARRRRDRSRPG
jgi:hypothetical protein